MSDRRLVIFDFDGVLVDSYATSFEVAQLMHPHLTEPEYRRLWDGNIFETERTLACGPSCRPFLSDDEFYDIYSPKAAAFTVASGMRDVVRALSESYPLVIISSSTTSDIKAILERSGALSYFKDVLGKDVHRSKVEKIRMVFEAYGIGPKESIFITDTLGDVREAEAHGLDVIAVSWGFHDAETLQRGLPFRIVDTPSELPDAIDDYFAGREPVR